MHWITQEEVNFILIFKGVGLNGGVILYNFTRLRSLPGGGMTEAVRFVWRRYKADIRLADQDILNIIFGISTQWEAISSVLCFILLHPRYLYELPCVWNYHVFQCKPDKTENPPISRQRNGLNLCLQAEKVRPCKAETKREPSYLMTQEGAALIHGNCGSFAKHGDPVFKVRI